jgi:hypothetical protein
MRLYCPLEVKVEPDSVLGEKYEGFASEFEYATIPNSVASDYAAEISAAIQSEMLPEEEGRGLAIYIRDMPLEQKVEYLWSSVEVHDNKLCITPFTMWREPMGQHFCSQ